MILTLAFLALGQALAQQEPRAGYVLEPEDVITVTVVGFPAFSGEFLIPPSGMVDLPILGSTKIADLSISQLTEQITRGMLKRLKHPEVIVTLKVPRVDRIFLVGDVRTGGVVQFHPGWRLAQAISAAGGLGEGALAADFHISILRGNEKQEYYYPDVLAGRPGSNPELRPNDVITILANALVPVNVVGQVKNQGLYRLKPEMSSVLAAIAASGGPSDTARISHVQVRHLDGTTEVVDLTPELVKGLSSETPKLRSGDLVIVPQLLDQFAVLGSIGSPGIYPIPEGRTLLLSDAMALCKSSDSAALSRYPRIGIVRREAGKEVRYVFNFGKYLARGDASQNPEIRPFDVIYVPQSPVININTVLAGISTIAIFGNYFKP